MRTSVARRARRALDRRLSGLPSAETFTVPPQGWVRAIREALGMSHAVLATRMGITASAAAALERSERAGRVRLDSLHRAAEAMDCDLVYAFVPRRGLDTTVEEAARARLSEHLNAVGQTMALEDQATGIDPAVVDDEVQALIDAGRVWT